jgi:hypothetical protein
MRARVRDQIVLEPRLVFYIPATVANGSFLFILCMHKASQISSRVCVSLAEGAGGWKIEAGSILIVVHDGRRTNFREKIKSRELLLSSKCARESIGQMEREVAISTSLFLLRRPPP